MTRTIASAFAAGLIATASIFPAHAQESTSRSISYADLDLRHPEAVHVLEQRVRNTAQAICGDADIRDLDAYEDVRACRAQAIAGALSQVAIAVSRAQELASSKTGAGAPVQTSAR